MKNLFLIVSLLFFSFSVKSQLYAPSGLVNSSGNSFVGINAPSPNVLLEMRRNGGATERNVMLKLTNQWNATTGALNEPTIIFDNGTTSTTYGTIGWTIGAQVAGTHYFRIGKYANGVHSEYFRIFDDGSIAIGHSNFIKSTGYKFSVAGKIICEEVRVKLYANWPDFVFTQDHKLRSLEEVESFIKENNHLPDVPSAVEVHENGIEAGEMFRIQMQKIEELTLYLLQMKKENEELKRRLEIVENK